LHFILALTHHEYGRVTSFSNIKSQFSGKKGEGSVPLEYYLPLNYNASEQPLHTRRANATFIMLARNSDMDNAVRSVREAEDRFNRKYRYPWVFLNDEPFSDDFKKYVLISHCPYISNC
jgi:alpha 1,2-mannosyltransferase